MAHTLDVGKTEHSTHKGPIMALRTPGDLRFESNVVNPQHFVVACSKGSGASFSRGVNTFRASAWPDPVIVGT